MAPRGLGGHERKRGALHGNYIGEPPAAAAGGDPRLLRREAAGRLSVFHEERDERVIVCVVLLRVVLPVDADELQVSRTVPVPVHARVEAPLALARVFGGAAGPREPRDPAFYFYSARGEPDVSIYFCARSLWVVSSLVESSPNPAIRCLLVSLWPLDNHLAQIAELGAVLALTRVERVHNSSAQS